eukprot:391676-Amphidinium_carterae.1
MCQDAQTVAAHALLGTDFGLLSTGTNAFASVSMSCYFGVCFRFRLRQRRKFCMPGNQYRSPNVLEV